MKYKAFFGRVDEKGKMHVYDQKYLKYAIAKLAGKEVVVKIMERDDTRTIPQNKYLHGGIITPLAEHYKGLGAHNKELFKEVMKEMFAPKIEIETFDGRKIERPIGTSMMTKKEMMNFIEAIRQWALEYDGTYIMTADEFKYGYGDME